MEEKQETPAQQAPPAATVPEEKKTEEEPQAPQAPQAEPSKPEEKKESGNESEDEDAEKAKGSWWGSGWGSGWGSSWGKSLTNAFNTVKEVTANVAEICVQDLKDFKGQIQEDTTKALNRNFYGQTNPIQFILLLLATEIDTTQVKKNAAGFWGQVSSAFTGEPVKEQSQSASQQESKAATADQDDSFDDTHQ